MEEKKWKTNYYVQELASQLGISVPKAYELTTLLIPFNKNWDKNHHSIEEFKRWLKENSSNKEGVK